MPLVDADLAAAELEGLLARLDEVRDTSVMHDKVARHRPLLLPVVGSIGAATLGGVQGAQVITASRRSFAAPVLQEGGGENARASQAPSRRSDGARLLSVREVAQRLAVCTATVYKLCDEGQLLHVHIMNAVRISEADLAAFVASRRTR
jgi:excisionase family DNA binding protein